MPDLFVFDGFCARVQLPSNGINLLEGRSLVIDRDCHLEMILGWISVVDPRTGELVFPGDNGFFKGPVKVIGGHLEGSFTVEYRK